MEISFNFIPNLILDEDNIKNRKVVGEAFMNFVDKLMQSRSRSPINRFQLKCGTAVEPSRIRWWITQGFHVTFLSIQEINLEINKKKFNNLPVGLFACRTLAVLKLQMHHSLILKVSEDAFLPTLKQLSLDGIAFSDETSLQRMFSCCAALQQAALHMCELKGFRSIRENGASVPLFPNLTSLTLYACEFRGCMKNLPDLLANTPVLRTLEFEELPMPRLKEYVIFDPLEEVPCCLMNCLKNITLQSFRGTKADMKMVEYFLGHAKVLQSLTIHLNGKKKNDSQISTCLLKFARASMFCQVVIK